jgi:putative tryptophan/tyrosine transport system substrate-binding protein
MRRRGFITVLGGAATAPLLGPLLGPLAVRAQQAMPVIGFLSITQESANASYLDGLRQGLTEQGFVEGRNIRVEYRWADGRFDRLPGFAADLVRQRVAIIFANGPPAARAAKEATATIPIVFSIGEDPVKEGLVASLSRPGANVTGFSTFTNQLFAKRLGLLKDAFPEASVFGLLVNPENPNAGPDASDARMAAAALGRKLDVLTARTEREIETSFIAIVQQQIGALCVGVDGLFRAHQESLIALAARHKVPTIYDRREFPAAGGLMSYGANYLDAWREAGVYVGRILRGEKPEDMPVQQATKLEFVINLKTAKMLGLIIPPTLLALADRVIE